METIGQRLKKEMKKRKITVKQLSYKTGIHKNAIIGYRNDRNTPTIYNFFEISEALQINPLLLYYGEKNE